MLQALLRHYLVVPINSLAVDYPLYLSFKELGWAIAAI